MVSKPNGLAILPVDLLRPTTRLKSVDSAEFDADNVEQSTVSAVFGDILDRNLPRYQAVQECLANRDPIETSFEGKVGNRMTHRIALILMVLFSVSGSACDRPSLGERVRTKVAEVRRFNQYTPCEGSHKFQERNGKGRWQ